jgi:hypothetical protein
MALNYFEPYLMDNLDNEPDMINFSLYNPVANAEIKLEQLVMKENHKLTKFFVEFYCILSHLQYNKQGLLKKAYLALPKRITKWFILKNWHHLSNFRILSKKFPSVTGNTSWNSLVKHSPFLRWMENPRKYRKANPRQDQKQNSNSNLNSNTTSGSKEKDKSKSNPLQPKKPDLSEKLGKDGKLLLQEHWCHLDNDLCLLCGKVVMLCAIAQVCQGSGC